MNRFSQEVLEAARKKRIDVKPSTSWTGISIHDALAARFAAAEPKGPLWERLKEGASLRSTQGWAMPGTFVGDAPCLLCFEPRLDNNVLEFARGTDLEAVLAECSGFVFYVCDADMNYLLCFNDHDYLIALGTAKPWLDERLKTQDQS